MSIEEQKAIKTEACNEAKRYMDNARETLQKAGKDGRVYTDRKYVRTAAGTAYNGVLIALDAYLIAKDISLPKPRQKSIDWYRGEVRKLDKKLLNEVNAIYDSLHLSGYYDGNPNVGNMEGGLAIAAEIIERIHA